MPWSLFFGFALKAIDFIMAKQKANEEARKAFLDFVATIESNSLASVRLSDDDRAQLSKLQKRRDKL